MSLDTATLSPIHHAVPASPGAPGHTHDHAHGHGHGHDHHDRAHAHGSAPARFRPPFSLVRLSLAGRLAIALALSAAIWAAALWAIHPIAA